MECNLSPKSCFLLLVLIASVDCRRPSQKNTPKTAEELARGSISFNDELESVIIESSAFGEPTGDAATAPLNTTVVPPTPNPPTEKPVVQTVVHQGLGFHWRPGSVVYSVAGSPIPKENITISTGILPLKNPYYPIKNYGDEFGKHHENGDEKRPQWSTVIRTQPGRPIGSDGGGKDVFKAATISRVLVPAAAATRLPIAENLVAHQGPTDNEILPDGHFQVTKTPDHDDAFGLNGAKLEPSNEGKRLEDGQDAFEHFKSVSKEPHTSASEKFVASARQGRQRNFSPAPASSSDSIVGTRSPTGGIAGNSGVVGDIRCMNMPRNEIFTSTIKLPVGFTEAPVFEDRPDIDPANHPECKLRSLQTSTPSLFRMHISDLEPCGVVSCKQPNGQEWLCVTIRFPLVPGLRLPEDEVIVIKCRPQDRSVAQRKSIDFLSADELESGIFEDLRGRGLESLSQQEGIGVRVEQRSPPTIYSGGLQEFESEIGLFRRLPGTSLFSARILPGNSIDLGEDIQLRSIVRSGDGWHHSRLTDVIVSRVGANGENDVANPGQSARLVYSDGCRNPKYSLVAPGHPAKDSVNPLINNFGFRAFMFQNMKNGDSIKISAKVMACVEAIDCAPALCADDRGEGFGRRRRRSAIADSSNTSSTREVEVTTVLTPTVVPPTNFPTFSASNKAPKGSNTTGFEGAIAVRILDRYRGGISEELVKHLEAVPSQNCKVYMLFTAVIGSVFCFLTSMVTIYILIRKCERRHKVIQKHQVEDESISMRDTISMGARSRPGTMGKMAARRVVSEAGLPKGFPQQPMTNDDADFWLNLLQAAKEQESHQTEEQPKKALQKEILKAFLDGTMTPSIANNKIYSPPSHVSGDSGYGHTGDMTGSTWSLTRRRHLSESSIRDIVLDELVSNASKSISRNTRGRLQARKLIMDATEQQGRRSGNRSLWHLETEDSGQPDRQIRGQFGEEAKQGSCWTEPRKRRGFPSQSAGAPPTPAPRSVLTENNGKGNVTKIVVGPPAVPTSSRPSRNGLMNRNLSASSVATLGDEEIYSEIEDRSRLSAGKPVMV